MGKMKRELFFMFACIVSVATTFISCTGDEFEDAFTQEQPQKTRAARTEITMEEVQARLDEIGTKYGTNINLLYVKDYSEVTESTFEQIERQIIKERNSTNINKTSIRDNVLINDNIIDEYDIATLNSEIEEIPDYDKTAYFYLSCYKYNTYPYVNYFYEMGFNFKVINGRTSVEAGFHDITSYPNAHGSNIDFFSHDVVSNSNDRIMFGFSFLFTINYEYTKNGEEVYIDKRAWINGSYDNGVNLLYTTDNDIRLELSH